MSVGIAKCGDGSRAYQRVLCGRVLVEIFHGIFPFIHVCIAKSCIQVGEIGGIKLQLLTYREGDTTPRKPLEAEVKMHAPKFYQESYYKDNDFFDGKAYIVNVLENKEMDEALRSLKDGKVQHKDAQDKPSKSQKPQRMPEKVVVDLHLTFREKLDECIADAHVKKVVFIHGKGNGSLKLELRKCLDRNYKRCQYQDASFEEYGGGATLVYVK